MRLLQSAPVAQTQSKPTPTHQLANEGTTAPLQTHLKLAAWYFCKQRSGKKS